MTSVKYNTFNDIEEPPILADTQLADTKLAVHCLICLQGPNTIDEIKSIGEMHFLKKTCNCICYSHHKCIETWLETNAVCPICKKPLLFPQTKLENVINIQTFETQTNYNCKETARIYICMIGVVFGMLLLGNVVTEFQIV
jgi:hypothetical protein